MKVNRQAIEKQRTLVQKLMNKWRVANILANRKFMLKIYKKLKRAERKLDKMLGLPTPKTIWTGSHSNRGWSRT